MGLPIRDTVVNCTVNGEVPAMTSAWLPTPEQIARIVAGAAVHVQISDCPAAHAGGCRTGAGVLTKVIDPRRGAEDTGPTGVGRQRAEEGHGDAPIDMLLPAPHAGGLRRGWPISLRDVRSLSGGRKLASEVHSPAANGHLCRRQDRDPSARDAGMHQGLTLLGRAARCHRWRSIAAGRSESMRCTASTLAGCRDSPDRFNAPDLAGDRRVGALKADGHAELGDGHAKREGARGGFLRRSLHFLSGVLAQRTRDARARPIVNRPPDSVSPVHRAGGVQSGSMAFSRA